MNYKEEFCLPAEREAFQHGYEDCLANIKLHENPYLAFQFANLIRAWNYGFLEGKREINRRREKYRLKAVKIMEKQFYEMFCVSEKT